MGTLTVPAVENARLTPPQYTEIDTKREACYLMTIETECSLKYELDLLKLFVLSRF